MALPIIFLDTSAIFAAVISPSGGGRALLQLGELRAIALMTGPTAIQELELVINRKAPSALPKLAVLLAQANMAIGPSANPETITAQQRYVNYTPDAVVLAEALAAKCDYFVTLDRKHFLENEALHRTLPMPIGTPGDCLAWFRGKFH